MARASKSSALTFAGWLSRRRTPHLHSTFA
jgi:hypothetical protein